MVVVSEDVKEEGEGDISPAPLYPLTLKLVTSLAMAFRSLAMASESSQTETML